MFNPSEIEPFFFEAMRVGYASSTKPVKGTVIEFPGSRTLKFEKGVFRLVDCWHTNPNSNWSFGTTIIYAENNPAWMMKYWGEYPKDLIRFLKSALRKKYDQGFVHGYRPASFCGCRGPRVYTEDSYIYTNNVHRGSNFNEFRGREEIVDEEKQDFQGVLGWHEYVGFSLL